MLKFILHIHTFVFKDNSFHFLVYKWKRKHSIGILGQTSLSLEAFVPA